MYISHVLIAGLFSTVFLTETVVADTDVERAALAKLTHELDALEPLIREAESQANLDVCIRFRYGYAFTALFTFSSSLALILSWPSIFER